MLHRRVQSAAASYRSTAFEVEIIRQENMRAPSAALDDARCHAVAAAIVARDEYFEALLEATEVTRRYTSLTERRVMALVAKAAIRMGLVEP